MASKKLKIRPLHDRLIVKRVDQIEKTQGGIIIPDSAKEKPQEAVVLAVGNGKTLEDGKKIPLEVKVGDRVFISKYAGDAINIDGQDCLIIREDSVEAIIEA